MSVSGSSAVPAAVLPPGLHVWRGPPGTMGHDGVQLIVDRRSFQHPVLPQPSPPALLQPHHPRSKSSIPPNPDSLQPSNAALGRIENLISTNICTIEQPQSAGVRKLHQPASPPPHKPPPDEPVRVDPGPDGTLGRSRPLRQWSVSTGTDPRGQQQQLPVSEASRRAELERRSRKSRRTLSVRGDLGKRVHQRGSKRETTAMERFSFSFSKSRFCFRKNIPRLKRVLRIPSAGKRPRRRTAALRRGLIHGGK